MNGSSQPAVIADGSCVRDCIHVQDLCTAHLLASRMAQRG